MPVLPQYGAPYSSPSSTWIILSLYGVMLVIAALRCHRRGKFSTTATAPSQLPTDRGTVPISPENVYTIEKLGSGADPSSPFVMGTKVTQETIIAAEGWTRHTSVFEGGGCQACKESEERMHLMDAAGRDGNQE